MSPSPKEPPKWMSSKHIREVPYTDGEGPISPKKAQKSLDNLAYRSLPQQTELLRVMHACHRRINGLAEEVEEGFQRYLCLRLGAIIAEHTPQRPSPNSYYPPLRHLFRFMHKLDKILGDTRDQFTSDLAAKYNQNNNSNAVEFRNTVYMRVKQKRLKAPTKVRQEILELYRKLPVELTLSALLLRPSSLPDEMLESTDWTDRCFSDAYLNQLLEESLTKRSEIVRIRDYVASKLYHHNKEFYNAYQAIPKIHKAGLSLILLRAHGFRRQLEMCEQFDGFRKTPLGYLFKWLNRSYHESWYFERCLYNQLFWYLWFVREFVSNPQFDAVEAQAISEISHPNSTSFSWGDMVFPVTAFPRSYVEFILDCRLKSENHRIVAWAILLSEIFSYEKHNHFLEDYTDLEPLEEFHREISIHQQVLIDNWGVVELPKPQVWGLEEFQIEHELAQEQVAKREQEAALEAENAELLKEWANPEQFNQAEEQEFLEQVESSPTQLRVAYCSDRQPDSQIGSFTLSSSLTEQSDSWSAFLRDVKCPSTISPQSLWNAIWHFDGLEGQALALLPYDDVQGLHWKKVKRGSCRLFFYRNGTQLYMHVMQRRDWDYSNI